MLQHHVFLQAEGAAHTQGACRVGGETQGARYQHDSASLHRVERWMIYNYSERHEGLKMSTYIYIYI